MKIGRLALGVHLNQSAVSSSRGGPVSPRRSRNSGGRAKRGPDWAPSFFDRAAPNPGPSAGGPLGLATAITGDGGMVEPFHNLRERRKLVSAEYPLREEFTVKIGNEHDAAIRAVCECGVTEEPARRVAGHV